MKLRQKKWILYPVSALAVLFIILLTVGIVYRESLRPEISVCLDAGHGGEDCGATYGERLEKDDNLRLTLLVRDKLEANGIKVYVTREDDTYLTLAERCQIANRKRCTLFVALHRNSSDAGGNGVEMWVKNTPSDTEWALAENMLSALEDVGISKARGVKSGYAKNADGNYYVNAHTNMDSCLAEIGFITSDEDNALFDENLDAYADAIAKGILETLDSMTEN
ncbi:MAG: N-acetylmuramoyl-L-alanine amidase [Candidatus Fimenecus sp.]